MNIDIQPQLKALSDRIVQLKEQIETEEATKTAFILPFIQLLGFDIFNPTEVVPEFTADIGLKKGEKVDFALFLEGEPILIIECKHWKADLNLHNSQLIRYFHVSKARFSLLTNGITYRFYTDLEKSNVMDERPFFEFDITQLKESHLQELLKFHKSHFDISKIVNNASSLKYMREIKQLFKAELMETTTDFARLFATKIYTGRLTENVMNQFRELVQKAINQTISESVNHRLQNALEKEAEKQEEKLPEPEEESKIITTEEELAGFRIIIAMLNRKIDITRIAYRDTQSYFGILLDNNNRKPICRLHFNGKQKYIGLINQDKSESKKPINSLNELYNFEEEILTALTFYTNKVEK